MTKRDPKKRSQSNSARVKQMICDCYKNKFGDEFLFYEGKIGRLSLACKPFWHSIKIHMFVPIYHRRSISLTANQLKGIE